MTDLLPQYGLTTTVGPSAEPVTVAQLEHQLRSGVPESDPARADWVDQLMRAIKSAREFCEEVTFRRLVTQTVRLRLGEFPASGPLELPCSPVQSVSSVAYLDALGASQALGDWSALLDTTTPLIYPPADVGWPCTKAGRADAVTVTFVAGYGSPSAVPERFKEAILLVAVHRIENPGDSVRDGVEVPPGARSLLQSLSARPYL